MAQKTRFAGLIFILLLITCPAFALVMKGKVYDRETKQPLARVNIINTNTQMVFQTDSTGLFTLNVSEGQTVEFRKLGYQNAYVQIKGGELPYYSIGLRKGANRIPEINIKGHNFRSDSIESQEVYRWALDHYTLNPMQMLNHPFDALSKQNRRIWAFQKRFQYFEKQKFIDYVFNDQLIEKITGLKGDNLLHYKQNYRPNYEQIQIWNTYEFYNYIKKTGMDFKFSNHISN